MWFFSWFKREFKVLPLVYAGGFCFFSFCHSRVFLPASFRGRLPAAVSSNGVCPVEFSAFGGDYSIEVILTPFLSFPPDPSCHPECLHHPTILLSCHPECLHHPTILLSCHPECLHHLVILNLFQDPLFRLSFRFPHSSVLLDASLCHPER